MFLNKRSILTSIICGAKNPLKKVLRIMSQNGPKTKIDLKMYNYLLQKIKKNGNKESIKRERKP